MKKYDERLNHVRSLKVKITGLSKRRAQPGAKGAEALPLSQVKVEKKIITFNF